MTVINGVYQHNFLASNNPKENLLCFICKKQKQNHLDYISNQLLNNNYELINNKQNNNQDIINNQHEKDSININNNNDVDENRECEICYDILNSEDIKINKLPYGHLFCSLCWFNYLKIPIIDTIVDDIKRMNHDCNKIISEEFIINHILKGQDLVEKYKKFKKRTEILKD